MPTTHVMLGSTKVSLRKISGIAAAFGFYRGQMSLKPIQKCQSTGGKELKVKVIGPQIFMDKLIITGVD